MGVLLESLDFKPCCIIWQTFFIYCVLLHWLSTEAAIILYIYVQSTVSPCHNQSRMLSLWYYLCFPSHRIQYKVFQSLHEESTGLWTAKQKGGVFARWNKELELFFSCVKGRVNSSQQNIVLSSTEIESVWVSWRM